jgi:GT2 family glycosyltransferase
MVLPYYQSQPFVREIIILDDASTCPIAETLSQTNLLDDPRISVIRFEKPQHQPVLRNVGVMKSIGEWIFMGEDDAFPEKNHFARLLAHAQERGLLVVAGRRIEVREGQTPESAREWANRQKGWVVGKFMFEGYFDKAKTAPSEFPFLHANALIHRDAFRVATFDPLFANCVSYREETDFFLTLHERGVRLGFTPTTAIYHFRGRGKEDGGIYQSSWLKKESLVWLNELRFEKKHRTFFVANTGILGYPVVRFPLFLIRRYSVALARRFLWILHG